MDKNIQDLEERYDLEFDKIIETIKKEKSKRVLLQFPDGFKPYATEIQKKLENLINKDKKIKTKPEFFIWFDTCFGACDLPIEVENIGIDLIIQFGHTAWDYSNKKNIKVIKSYGKL